MVIFANILLLIWSSKNCDIIYLKKKMKIIIFAKIELIGRKYIMSMP